MLEEINTVFDMSKFEEAPIMRDATAQERQWLIDAYLKTIPPWEVMEFYESCGASEELECGIKAHAIGDTSTLAYLDTARCRMRQAPFIEHDIDDIIYDAWCKREVGYSI